MNQQIKNFLEKNQIKYTLHEHPPVYTCEEAEKYCGDIPGMPCKNLFLRNDKKTDYYLVVLPAKKRMDLKKFSEIVSSKISFASENDLKNILDLTPGAVSPFGLLNDKEVKTKLYIDEDLWNADIVSFHPNDNSETLEITREMFHRFINKLEHKENIIEL